MDTTTNYGLKKPAYEDGADIETLNANADAIDVAIKARADDLAAHTSNASVHMTTLICTKSSTNYALTGLTATSGKVPVMFSAPTAFAAGDTVTIDGTAYALKTTDGSALTAGAWAAEAIITGTADVDSKVLYVEPSAPVGAIPSRRHIIALSSDTTLTSAQSGSVIILNGSEVHTLTLPNDLALGSTCEFDIFVWGWDWYLNAGSRGFLNLTSLTATNPYLLKGGNAIRLLNNGYNWFMASTRSISADKAAADIDPGTPGLRNMIILNKTDSVPTGLADNTVVLRKQS